LTRFGTDLIRLNTMAPKQKLPNNSDLDFNHDFYRDIYADYHNRCRLLWPDSSMPAPAKAPSRKLRRLRPCARFRRYMASQSVYVRPCWMPALELRIDGASIVFETQTQGALLTFPPCYTVSRLRQIQISPPYSRVKKKSFATFKMLPTSSILLVTCASPFPGRGPCGAKRQ
jgi:hypothetical protein